VRTIIFTWLLYVSITAHGHSCHSQLWPDESPIHHGSSYSIQQDMLLALKRESDKQLIEPPHPVAQLASAGKSSLEDVHLIASRKALQDADRAAILALSYRLTHQAEYLTKVTDILVNWARINQPTGHPIDETRLEGMIWAYDLISCHLSSQDNTLILSWFERLHAKKMAWRFGKITTKNNHRIHQLKMLLLLDNVLNKKINWENDRKTAIQYSTINLNNQSGESIDYFERSALYYHNYVLQPWLEISLIANCCKPPVIQAFMFLRNQILTHHIAHEFLHSHANIDILRAHAGFTYAKQDSTFKIARAAPTIIAYYTLTTTLPEPALWMIQKQVISSPRILFLKARRILWQQNLEQ